MDRNFTIWIIAAVPISVIIATFVGTPHTLFDSILYIKLGVNLLAGAVVWGLLYGVFVLLDKFIHWPFSLAIKSFPHVTQVGDTTTGAFSDAIGRQLPNGWGYSLSIGDYRNAQGVSHEGVGLTPDVVVRNTSEDIENGIVAF